MANQDNRPDEDNSQEQNWSDLANHFKDKVLKRTSELSYLHTRAGFLIAGAVIAIQITTGLDKFKDSAQILCVLIAALLATASLILAIISMHKGKSSTPLNPDEMIQTLLEQSLSRADFSRWLAKSYATANTAFNNEYNSKYVQQVISGALLVLSLAISIVLKGIQLYG